MSLMDAVRSSVEQLPGWLAVLVVALIPVLEVRAAIPLGVWTFGMSGPSVFFWALFGNLIVVPVLMALLAPAERLIRRASWGNRLFDGLIARARKKGDPRREAAKRGGLVAIVALPVPGAGTWTAVLVAYVFGMSRREALPSILVGALIECAIVLAIVLTGSAAWQWVLSW